MNQATAARPATAATPTPTPMPVLAPVEREAPSSAAADGVERALIAVLVGGLVVVKTFPVVVALVVAVDVVAVRAIKAVGVKAHVVASGFSELRDDYVSFNTATLMLVRVSWLRFQHTFIWFSVSVHCSLLSQSHFQSAKERCRNAGISPDKVRRERVYSTYLLL